MTQTTKTNSTFSLLLRLGLLGGFLVVLLLAAVFTFLAVRDFVAGWELTSLPGVTVKEIPVDGEGAASDPSTDMSLPLQPVAGPTPPPWDGANRVSLLVMGLDYRDWQAGEGPPRTDTMILFSVDPINRTAGMLSIPRDLWVNIPGHNYGRINTAYQLGEAFQEVGGGPGLATKTVEELLGVPIDYYAQVDFGAFVRFIDELGGVKVNVPEKLKVDLLGDNTFKMLQPGLQTMDGQIALAYARTRKTEGGDFDRSQRQQAVILAIRERILQKDMLPTLISKAPALYEELSSGVHTNLSLDQVIKLAWLASQIPQENIKSGAIAADQVAFAQSPDGEQQVLKPLTEKIRILRDEIFSESAPASPLAVNLPMADVLAAEGARVSVLNGSSSPGLAAKVSDLLKAQGVNVTETGNADQLVGATRITYYTGKPYTLKFLVDLLKITQFNIHHLYDPAKQVDIQIIAGDDLVQNGIVTP